MSKAYLAITLHVAESNRSKAGEVYNKYKQPFLETIHGATSKELLVRAADVQVLHGFNTTTSAEKYLQSPLFNNDVVSALKPFLLADPDIRIYEAM